MKMSFGIALALVLGAQVASAAERCSIWPWSPAVIAMAEDRLLAEDSEIMSRYSRDRDELASDTLELQRGSGVLTPADIANHHVMMVLEVSRIVGAEMARQAQVELDAAYARYMRVYERETMTCW